VNNNTVPSIVRRLIINLWGEYNLHFDNYGLLREHDVLGVEIPAILFDLVEERDGADGWRVWFMTHRAYLPSVTPQAAAFSAPMAVSASGLAWDHVDRIPELANFFNYFERVISRSVFRFQEAGGTVGLGYLMSIEGGVEQVVVQFAANNLNWNEIVTSWTPPAFNRVLQYVLASTGDDPMLPCDCCGTQLVCECCDSNWIPNPNYPDDSDDPWIGPVEPCECCGTKLNCECCDSYWILNPLYPDDSDTPWIGPVEPCECCGTKLNCECCDSYWISNPLYPDDSDNPWVGPVEPCECCGTKLVCECCDSYWISNPNYPDDSDDPWVGPVEPCECCGTELVCECCNSYWTPNPNYPDYSDDPWLQVPSGPGLPDNITIHPDYDIDYDDVTGDMEITVPGAPGGDITIDIPGNGDDMVIVVPNPDPETDYDHETTVTVPPCSEVYIDEDYNTTVTVPGPDGDIVIEIPGDGGDITVTIPGPDGDTIVTLPPGSDITVDDEGNLNIQLPPGGPGGTVTLPGGEEVDVPPGGGVTVTQPDGEVTVTNPCGNVWGDVMGNGRNPNMDDVMRLLNWVTGVSDEPLPNPAAANWHGQGVENTNLFHVMELLNFVTGVTTHLVAR